MDFGSLLHEAQKNGQVSKSGGNFYKTKFEPPKKENKTKTLSSNIQKFLAKKEEEEKRKADEARKKREELISMRDEKATNKIKKMLKVIKSANKSVLEDAVDNNNTAVTMAGPDQPDEDDYGYVSQEASAFYSKMMDKYKSIPEEEKFASSKKSVNHDLLSTKDRVRAAIIRHQEEESMPHKRKRKSRQNNETDFIADNEIEVEEKKIDKPKPKRPAPPPLDFNALLKIAEKKQFEPVVVETKKPEKIEEPERLMTKKQKREYEQMKAYKEAKLRREQERNNNSSDHGKKPKSESTSVSKPVNPLAIRIPKVGEKLNKTNSVEPAKNVNVSKIGSANNTSSKPHDRERLSSSKPHTDDGRRKEESREVNRKQDLKSFNHTSTPKNSERSNNRAPPPNIPSSSKPSQRPEKHSDRSNGLDKRPISTTVKKPQLPSNSSTIKQATLPISKNISKNIIRDSPTDIRPKSDQKLQKALTKPADSGHPVSNNKSERKPEPSKVIAKSTIEQNKIPSRNPIQKEQPKSFNSQHKKILPPPNVTIKKNVDDSRPKIQGQSSSSSNQKQSKPLLDQRPRVFPPPDMKKARQFPPPDVKGARQFPPKDINPRREQREKPRPAKRRILDSDSEYDSELDDFIDDGPQNDGNDISKYIKEIFGYDKSKYRDADDDDRNMESNFSQVMREEYISKKIGIMEDLEDMRMEALEKKRKGQGKKRRRISDDD